jgi:hypothetical protein
MLKLRYRTRRNVNVKAKIQIKEKCQYHAGQEEVSTSKPKFGANKRSLKARYIS